MGRFEKRNLHIYFEDHFVRFPDDEYCHLERTELFFRFL